MKEKDCGVGIVNGEDQELRTGKINIAMPAGYIRWMIGAWRSRERSGVER